MRSACRVKYVYIWSLIVIVAASSLLLTWHDSPDGNAKLQVTGIVDEDTITRKTTPEKSDLLKVLEKAAGIYQKTSPKYGQENLENTVLMTCCNSGYLAILLNWICYVKSHDLKFFVWSLDEDLHSYLTKRNILSYYNPEGYKVTKESVGFWSFDFQRLTSEKLVNALQVMNAGYDIWFSDADIVFVDDPWPYFKRDCDYEHQQNPFHYGHTISYGPLREGNTGFYFIKSSERTRELYREAIGLCATYYERWIAGEKLNIYDVCGDQANLWETIRSWYHAGRAKWYFEDKTDDELLQNNETLTYRALSILTHPVGSALFSQSPGGYLKLLKTHEITKVAIVHANFLTGEESKIEQLKRFGFWISANDVDAIADEWKWWEEEEEQRRDLIGETIDCRTPKVIDWSNFP